MASMSGVVESGIRSKLTTLLEAKHEDVINESYMHNVPKGSETHFKVVVVSDKFEGLPLIKVCYSVLYYNLKKLELSGPFAIVLLVGTTLNIHQ